MKNRFGWGILGTGRIAAAFVTDLKKLPEARLVAVGSRSLDKAAEFAGQHGAQRFYGSYAELVADPDVDIIYVATPHPFHMEHTILALQHGKAVLCEKPMGINEQQVQAMVSCAREKKLFLMEAMWTRFLPVTRTVQRWLKEKRLGQVQVLAADFGFRTAWHPEGRLLNPALGGGALLDVGVYLVAYASMVFGAPPAEMQAAAYLGETGVDEQTAMLFRYADGALALLFCAVRTNTAQEAHIQGTEGSMHIPAFWHPTTATLQVDGQKPLSVTDQVGYHFEAAEVMACLWDGQTESTIMPLDESLTIARTMDQVRAKIGLIYPMEQTPRASAKSSSDHCESP